MMMHESIVLSQNYRKRVFPECVMSCHISCSKVDRSSFIITLFTASLFIPSHQYHPARPSPACTQRNLQPRMKHILSILDVVLSRFRSQYRVDLRYQLAFTDSQNLESAYLGRRIQSPFLCPLPSL